MSKLHRYYAPGQIYFITVVTAKRRPILTVCPEVFFDAWRTVYALAPFKLEAFSLLPDHFHSLIDPRDASLAEIIRRFKLTYTVRLPKELRPVQDAVWQSRFWDHIIRSHDDLRHHLDYIHFNPVKHHLVEKVEDWPWSSFDKFRSNGLYPPGWGDFTQLDPDALYGE